MRQSLASSITSWRRGHYCSHNSTLSQHTMKFFQTRSANPWITALRYRPPTHRSRLTCRINSLTTFSFALYSYIFIEHLFFKQHQATWDPTFAIVCVEHWRLIEFQCLILCIFLLILIQVTVTDQLYIKHYICVVVVYWIHWSRSVSRAQQVWWHDGRTSPRKVNQIIQDWNKV